MIFAIDPGPVRSAWLILSHDECYPVRFGIDANAELRDILDGTLSLADAGFEGVTVAIEMVASYGMPVGKEVFETVRHIGRFEQIAANGGREVKMIYRKQIVTHLCGSARAKDSNVRQALIDRYGGEAAIGTKKAPGALYGIHKDVWSALAVACVALDLARGARGEAVVEITGAER